MVRPTVSRGAIMMVVTVALVVGALVLTVTIGVRQAALFLSGALVLLAIARMVSPAPGLAVRSRGFDVALLLTFAALIAVLVLTVPADML